VGILPTNGKCLKINGRFRRYVVQDYRTSVTVNKRDLLEGDLVSEKRYAVEGRMNR